MYSIGIREIVIHPLIFSASDMTKTIEWTDDEWTHINNVMIAKLLAYPELDVRFVEGISNKYGPDTCFTDKNLFAVDSSGNFGGCYLIPNNKDLLGDYIMGNFFDDVVHEEKYEKYNADFKDKRENYPECQTCDLADKCYTCPAMSLLLTGDAWAPSPMCKKMVQLSVHIDENNKAVKYLVGEAKFLQLSTEEQIERGFSSLYRFITQQKNTDTGTGLCAVTVDSIIKGFAKAIIEPITLNDSSDLVEILTTLTDDITHTESNTIFNFLKVNINEYIPYEKILFMLHYYMNTKGKI
jgi:radical SAM protein with 4Fe4S-binding SPASM domain